MVAIPEKYTVRPGSLARLKQEEPHLYRQIMYALERDDPGALEIVLGLQACGDDFLLTGTQVRKSKNQSLVGALMIGGFRTGVVGNEKHVEFTNPLFSGDITHKSLHAASWRSHLGTNFLLSLNEGVEVFQSIARKKQKMARAAKSLGYVLEKNIPPVLMAQSAMVSGVKTDVYQPDETIDSLPETGGFDWRFWRWLGLGARIQGPTLGSVELYAPPPRSKH